MSPRPAIHQCGSAQFLSHILHTAARLQGLSKVLNTPSAAVSEAEKDIE